MAHVTMVQNENRNPPSGLIGGIFHFSQTTEHLHLDFTGTMLLEMGTTNL